jgi:hypothetical protein
MTMPGVCSRMTHGSRADGMASSRSLPKFVPSVFDFVSTTGLIPETVTVSSTVDTSSLALISALNPAWITMSVWTVFLKPVRSKASV